MAYDLAYLDCYTGVVEEDKLYVVNVSFGMLLEYNLKSFTYKVLCPINLPDITQPVRVNSIIKKENFIYMSIENSWNIFEHNLQTGQSKVYGSNFSYIDGSMLVRKSLAYGDEIWMFPYDIMQPVRIFNIRTKEFETGILIGECLLKTGGKINSQYRLDFHMFQEDNIIRVAIYNSPYIMEINMESCECKLYEIDGSSKIALMFYKNGKYLLSFMGSNILAVWHPKQGISEKYFPEEISAQPDWTYQYIYADEEKIIAVPVKMQNVCMIDRKRQETSIINYPEDFARVHIMTRWMYQDGLTYGEKLVLLPFSVNKFIIINLDNGEMETYACRIQKDEIEKYYTLPRLTNNVTVDEGMAQLAYFINFIGKKDTNFYNFVTDIGAQIWKRLK